MSNELIIPKDEQLLMKDKPLSNEEFVNWIKESEAGSTISLQEAKNKWEEKKKELQQLIK